VDRQSFGRLVSFRYADMRALSDDLGLRQFDFLWSSCAFEHLGNLAAGLTFVRSAMKFLRPGGIAIHTTEFNLSSNDATMEEGWAVLYRQRDIEELDRTLRLDRCGLEPVDFDAGTHRHDLNYDTEPYERDRNGAHIKLRLFGHVCTSILLIARKG
jgi:SAM-dependent methyltransferase